MIQAIIPVVGMGVTHTVGSDSYPYTVISVCDKYIVIQGDTVDYANEDEPFKSNPKAKTINLAKNRKGEWQMTVQNLDTGRWNLVKRFGHFTIGERYHYIDYDR